MQPLTMYLHYPLLPTTNQATRRLQAQPGATTHRPATSPSIWVRSTQWVDEVTPVVRGWPRISMTARSSSPNRRTWSPGLGVDKGTSWTWQRASRLDATYSWMGIIFFTARWESPTNCLRVSTSNENSNDLSLLIIAVTIIVNHH